MKRDLSRLQQDILAMRQWSSHAFWMYFCEQNNGLSDGVCERQTKCVMERETEGVGRFFSEYIKYSLCMALHRAALLVSLTLWIPCLENKK